MTEQHTCLNCSSTNVTSGTIHSTGKASFRPDDAKFLQLRTANVDIEAYLCMDCGFVFLKADPQKVKALTAQAHAGRTV